MLRGVGGTDKLGEGDGPWRKDFLLLILGIDLLPARFSSSYNECLLWRLLNEFPEQSKLKVA